MPYGLIGSAHNGRRQRAPLSLDEERDMMAQQAMQRPMQAPPGMIGSAAPKKKGGGIAEMFGYDQPASGMGALEWWFSSPEARQKAEANTQFERSIGDLGLNPQDAARARLDTQGFFKSRDEATAPVKLGPGDHIARPNGEGGYETAYSIPPESSNLVGRAHGTFIDEQTGEQMVIMADGSAKSTGHQAYIAPQIVDMGGGVRSAIDRRTLGQTPINSVQDMAYNTAVGKSAEKQGTMQGEAAFNLPQVESRAKVAIDSISNLRSRDLESRFGLQSKIWAVPGTEGADVQAMLNQVQSQAFLNAFDQLRGAGAITEMEGQAATRAITRLANQNISVGEAIKAMDELAAYYQKGIDIARKKATAGPTLPQRPGAAPAGEYSVDDLLKMYGD